MFMDFSASQVVGAFPPSEAPDAFRPRKDGQFCACPEFCAWIMIARQSTSVRRKIDLITILVKLNLSAIQFTGNTKGEGVKGSNNARDRIPEHLLILGALSLCADFDSS